MKLTAEIVEGFVGSILAKRFDGSTTSPDFHKEFWEYATSVNQYVAVAAPRGHAKSTAGTLAYSLAEVLFRCSRFLVIVSDTEAQAIMFIRAIAQELQENEDLFDLFSLKKNAKNEVQFLKDTESDIIVEFTDGNTFRIVGKGAEQKVRGLNWNGTRPDLIIIDDLENDELVMNKERREKLRRWFRGALLPALSPKGKLRYWGTILHIDSLLSRLMPKQSSKFRKETELKVWEEWPDKKVRGWLAVLYRAHDKNMEKFLWEKRFPKSHWIATRDEYAKDGALDLYSQEYLNQPLDETNAFFRRSDLLPRVEEDKKKRLTYYMTVDLAISQDRKADFSVFCIAGADEDKVIHIVNMIRERLDGREICETLLGLQKAYQFEAIGIEEMMISQAIGPFLREEMQRQNIWPNLVKLKHNGKDKVRRANSIQARMRAKFVKFDKSAEWYPDLEDELCKFPRGRHDDQVDALAYVGLLLDKIVEAPTDEEIEDEEYEIDRRQSGNANDGRSRTTGY